MNERLGNNKIYLLAKEAGLIEFEQLDWNSELVSPTYESVAKSRKFAELIVRRCINIACEYDKPKLSGPGLAIACNIESHFDIYIEEDGRFVK
jgi:hypothetical protein